MKYGRLTNDLRTIIVRKARERAERSALDELGAREAAIFEEVIRRALGPEQWAHFLETPQPWFSQRRHVMIQVAGTTVEIANIAGLRTPKNTDRYHVFERPQDDAFCDLVLALEDDQAALNKRMRELEAQTKGIVESVATIDRLLEVWPEAIELIPADYLAPKVRLSVPIGAIAAVNAAAKLPTVAVAA